jgi:hypothetical protein
MPPKSIVQKQTNPLKPILTLRVITIKHLTLISGLNYGKIKFEYQYTLARGTAQFSSHGVHYISLGFQI